MPNSHRTILSLIAGDVLVDRYKLIKFHGQGAMGDVWKAQDLELDTTVAVKLLPPEFIGSEAAEARLRAEAKIGRDLSHKTIVRLHDYQRDPMRQGISFLVMEFVEGSTLESRLKKGSQPIELVIGWAAELAAGIDYAHTRKVLHRDIKPGNIIVESSTGRARLLDFGIGREIRNTMSTVSNRTDTSGTLAYMSPEQLNGDNYPQNDVYSFAATLYHSLAGRPPFDDGDIRTQIQHKQPTPIADQPEHVNAALLAGLAKRFEDRPATAAELVEHLCDKSAGGETSGTSSSLFTDRVELPFECVSMVVLHDDRTAIVAGVDGDIAAVDLELGSVVGTIKAETHVKPKRGGGEIDYLANVYFFLERGDSPGTFYTMSHAGSLKLWHFGDGFRLQASSPLVQRNKAALYESLRKGYGRSGWSSWTCYNRGLPEPTTPFWIMDAKITPDGQHIVCLTSWFVAFRCSLDGSLAGSPFVVGDAFSIESASADGSQIYLGQSRSIRGDSIIKTTSDGELVAGASHHGMRVGTRSFCRFPDDHVFAGGLLLDSKLQRLLADPFQAYPRVPIRFWAEKQLALAPGSGRIVIYNTDSLKEEGMPLVGGFQSDPRDCAVIENRDALISLEPKSLQAWSLRERRPFGEKDGSILRHGMSIHNAFDAGNGISIIDSGRALGVINLTNREIQSIQKPDDLLQGRIFAVFAESSGQYIDLLSIHSRKEPRQRDRSESIFRRLLSAAIAPEEYKTPLTGYLRQYRLLAGGITLISETRLADATSDFGSAALYAADPKAIRYGDTECIILAGGHLLRYCMATSSIERGPVDVSREPEDDAAWHFRDTMALDANNRTIFLRSSCRSVLAVDAFSFERRYIFDGTTSMRAPSCSDVMMLPCNCGGVILSLRSEDGKDILTRFASPDGKGMPKAIQTIEFDEHSVESLYRLDDNRIAYGTYSGVVGVLDIREGKIVDKNKLHSQSVKVITRVPGTDDIATVSNDGTIRFCSMPDRSG